MSMILTIDANPEKLQERLMRFFMTIRRLGDPNLYLGGVGALPIEVFKREILFQLLEQQLYFPSLAVYVDDVFHLHGHVIGEQRYDFRLFLRRIDIGDNTGLVFNILSALYMFPELHDLDSTLHEAARQHMHCVRKSIIYKILLHLCHVCDATIGQFLKPGIVYVGPVHGNDISIVIIRGLQHKAVIGCG